MEKNLNEMPPLPTPNDAPSKSNEGVERCKDIIDLIVADGNFTEEDRNMIKMIALQENLDYNEIIEHVEDRIKEQQEQKITPAVNDTYGIERCKEIAELVIADGYLSEDDKNLLKMVSLQENVDYDEIIEYIEDRLEDMEDEADGEKEESTTQYAEFYDECFDIPLSRTLFHNWFFVPRISVRHDGIHLLFKKLQSPIYLKGGIHREEKPNEGIQEQSKKLQFPLGWRGFIRQEDDLIKPEDIVCYRKNRAIVSIYTLMIVPWQGYKIYGMDSVHVDQLKKFILKYTEFGKSIKVSRKVKGNRLFLPNLYVKGDHIMYWKRLGILGRKYSSVYINLHDVSFFNVYRSTIGKKLYFGYYDQIFINGVSTEDSKKLNDYCKQFSRKLSQEGDMRHANYPLLLRLIRSLLSINETLTLTDDAVIYYRTSWGRQETTYLPFDEVKVFIDSHPLFSFLTNGKTLKLMGVQNIITKYKFNREFVNQIRNTVKTNEIEQEYYLTSLWWLRKYIIRKRPSIIFTKDGRLIYSKPQYKKYAVISDDEVKYYYIQKNSLLRRTLYLCVKGDNIRINKHKHRVSFDMNIRVDQQGVNYDMIIDNFNVFRWNLLLFFGCGSLKRLFKRKGYRPYKQYLKDCGYKRKDINKKLEDMKERDFSGDEQQDAKNANAYRSNKVWMKQMNELMKYMQVFKIRTL